MLGPQGPGQGERPPQGQTPHGGPGPHRSTHVPPRRMEVKPQRDQQGRGQEAGAEGQQEVGGPQGIQGLHSGLRGSGPGSADLTCPPRLQLPGAPVGPSRLPCAVPFGPVFHLPTAEAPACISQSVSPPAGSPWWGPFHARDPWSGRKPVVVLNVFSSEFLVVQPARTPSKADAAHP